MSGLRFEPPSPWDLLVQHDAIEAQIFDDVELKRPGMQPVLLLALGMARVCRDWHDRKLLGGNYWEWLFRYLYDGAVDDPKTIQHFQWELRYDVPRYVSGITQIGGRCEGPAKTADGRCNQSSTCGPHVELRPDGTRVGHHFCARHRHLGKAIEAANPDRFTLPKPPMNTGGRLAEHFAMDWTYLYGWAENGNRHAEWEPPPNWERPTPPRPRLAIVPKFKDETP